MKSRTSTLYGPNSSIGFEKNGHFISGPFVPSGSVLDLQPSNTLLDRFELKRKIADGRGSAVYLAQDLIESIEVALKIINAGPLAEEWMASRLHHEMKVNRMILDFEHVVRVFDIHSTSFEGTSLLFLSMEYAEGGDLRGWLIENQKDIQVRRSIGLEYFLQVCRGLLSIHAAGITHLDIKPENMLFSNGALKISDFGSAIAPWLLKGASQPGKGIFPSELGTPRYMSPEHFMVSEPARLSPRSDIYSLGVILYELIHPQCRPPFEGSPAQLRELHLKASPPPLPDVPEKLDYVVKQCLEKSPDKRYQNMKELLVDLEHGPNKGTIAPTREIEEIWSKARELFSKGNLNETSGLLEEVLYLDPDHSGAGELKDKINKRFIQTGQLYRMITEGFEGTDLDTLTGILEEALAIYPEHPDGVVIQTRLDAKAIQLTDALENGGVAMKKGLWETALHWLRRAIEIDPGKVQLKPTIEALSHIKSIRGDINQALNRNDVNEARRLACLLDAVVEEMIDSVPIFRE